MAIFSVEVLGGSKEKLSEIQKFCSMSSYDVCRNLRRIAVFLS
jgi:hypothetical protein